LLSFFTSFLFESDADDSYEQSDKGKKDKDTAIEG